MATRPPRIKSLPIFHFVAVFESPRRADRKRASRPIISAAMTRAHEQAGLRKPADRASEMRAIDREDLELLAVDGRTQQAMSAVSPSEAPVIGFLNFASRVWFFRESRPIRRAWIQRFLSLLFCRGQNGENQVADHRRRQHESREAVKQQGPILKKTSAAGRPPGSSFPDQVWVRIAESLRTSGRCRRQVESPVCIFATAGRCDVEICHNVRRCPGRSWAGRGCCCASPAR